LVIESPTPPGFMQTIWQDDARFVNTYWAVPGKTVYSTFDWGIRDEDRYFSSSAAPTTSSTWPATGWSTREIEESISGHSAVAEVAVVGVADALKGQVAMAFVVLKDASVMGDEPCCSSKSAIMKRVDGDLGAVGAAGARSFVTALPKTRSGKLRARHSGGV
jgi:propionyl-CoA synthetase